MPSPKSVYAVGVALVLGLLAACASVPPPSDAISEAEQAIERAQQAKASEFAGFELAQAERKLERAKELSASESNEDKTQARRLAKQASVDARLAEEKGQLGRTRQTYEELQEAVNRGSSEQTGGEQPQGGME